MDLSTFTARQVVKRHRDPAGAFKPFDGLSNGTVDIRVARDVIQSLTAQRLTGVQMLGLVKQYGDGKSLFDYTSWLADQQLPVPAVAMPHAAAPATPRSVSRRAPEVGRSRGTYLSQPGIDKEADVRILERADSRLLQFGSDSVDLTQLIDGKNPAVFTASISRASGSRPSIGLNTDRRAEPYGLGRAAIVGSGLAEIQAHQTAMLASERNFSALQGEGTTGSLADPLWHTSSIGGRIADFIAEAPASVDPTSEYLPYVEHFDGGFPRLRPHDAKQFHSGILARVGGATGIAFDTTWKNEFPEGYMLPLPHSIDTETPKAIVADPLFICGELLQAGGVGMFGSDHPAYLAEIEALKQYHLDPLYHDGQLREAGGLSGYAEGEQTWLQVTPLTRRQITHSNKKESKDEIVPRVRLHVPHPNRATNWTIGTPQRPAEAVAGEAAAEALQETLGSSPTEGSAAARAPRLPEGSGEGTPLITVVDSPTGAVLTYHSGSHHGRFGHRLGGFSATAAARAASPSARFDAAGLARVREAMRARLPSKDAAASSVLRARLSHLDGDGDGKVSEGELLTGCARLFPDLDATAVGTLVRYMRYKASVAEVGREFPASVSHDGREGIAVADIAAWVLRSAPGGGVGGEAPSFPSCSGILPPSAMGPPPATRPASPLKSKPEGALSMTDSAAMAFALRQPDDLAALSASLGGDRKAPSSYSERHRRASVHAGQSAVKRGDALVHSAGNSYAAARAKDVGDPRGEAADRRWQEFRVKWEAGHGGPARREFAVDAAEPSPGPTWAKAKPAPFVVLRLSKGP
jgi:hypothetical protein